MRRNPKPYGSLVCTSIEKMLKIDRECLLDCETYTSNKRGVYLQVVATAHYSISLLHMLETEGMSN